MQNSNLSLFLGFNNKYVADLAFLLLSPSLQKEVNFDLNIDANKLWNWLENEDENPTNINLHFQNYSYKKLGYYAEELMVYFFMASELYNILAHDVQLFDGKETIGELDFIIEEVITKKIIHLEISVKFYLKYDNQSTKKIEFLGPDTSDSLDKKYTNLFTQQIFRAKNFPLDTILGKRKISDNKTIFKGVLFYPLAEFRKNEFSYPEFIHPKHLKSWYLKLDELMENTDPQIFYPIEKSDYLSLYAKQSYEKKDFVAFCKKQFEMGKKAVMLQLENGERGMIVPNKWPN